MVDFLKAFPFMTIEDYLWKYSIPMIKIMGMDNSHVNYLSKKEIERRNHSSINLNDKSIEQLNNDLGVRIQFPND